VCNILLAISFLTIIPAYGNRIAGEKDMVNSLYFYPLVGFIIGGVLAFTAYITEYLSLGLAGDALIIVVWIIITGALHLDGLMDSADGLFSGKDREKQLEIMRDSRVGAMGVVILAAVMLLKLTFLNEIPCGDKYWVLLIAAAAGRWAMVYAISFFPYARSEPGLGNSFGGNQDKTKITVVAALILLAGAFLAGHSQSLIILAITVVLMMLVARWLAGCLGGMTGDIYGALCELTETLFIIITVILQ